MSAESVEIKDVVALAGAPGLHKILKADEKAIVIESMDDRKKRQLIKGSMVVTKLMDVSIYTDDDSEPLVNVLKNIREKYTEGLPVNKLSGKDELMNFLGEVLPNYDREKVYPSNVKKLVAWYEILEQFSVNLDVKTEENPEASSTVEETASEEE
ncbi:MAG: DUF5606 domain-containing protein [Bacteroidia bacterium]|nr:DUF5606 domain-containing protein [Bacteroidia bacterium]